jgi:hypothetical protein
MTLVNPDPDNNDVATYQTRMDACQAAISEAMLRARESGEEWSIAVCVDCPKDWTGGSRDCITCDIITVQPCGKVTFEGIH